MEEIQSPNSISTLPEEFSLLDFLIILMENTKLLILVPLLAGLCALGIGFILPQTYESVAVLQVDQFPASLMTTASILDPVIVNLGLADGDTAEEARYNLRRKIRAVVGRSDKLLTLTVSARSAQQAQTIAGALLQQAFLASRPRASAAVRLEAQLAEARQRFKNAQDAAGNLARRLDSPSVSAGASGSEVIRGYSDLLNTAAEAQKQISLLETQLEGPVGPAQLVQAPTLALKPSLPKKGLIAIGATLATGLLLLLFVFARHALRNTAKNTQTAGKLARIRRLLGKH